MKNKKLLVLSVCLIIIITIGTSYAYFAASLTGLETTSTVVLNSGVLNITYNDESPLIILNDITPQNEEIFIKEFTITGENTTQNDYMIYRIDVVIDNNTFSNGALSLTLESENTSNSGSIVPSISNRKINSNTTLTLGSGTFNPSENATHTYRIKFYFLETQEDQSIDMNKSFAAHIVIIGEKSLKEEKIMLKRLQIGDFVEYDAGTWTQTEIDSILVGPVSSPVPPNNSLEEPELAFEFGGFVSGTSRNNGSIEDFFNWRFRYAYIYEDDPNDTEKINGWRIFDIDEENEIITLISAAEPENYYMEWINTDDNRAYITQYILTGEINENWPNKNVATQNYIKRDFSMYENEEYNATNARVLTYTELRNWYSKYIEENIDIYDDINFRKIYQSPYQKYLNLIDNHSYYWLGEAYDSTYCYYVSPSNRYINVDDGTWGYGFRMLVDLPLNSFQNYEPLKSKTVSLKGMIYYDNSNKMYYDTDTIQSYNVWSLE